MSINLSAWKRDNPGRPVPLAMFANVAGSYLWALDRGRRGARDAVPDHAGRARPERHDRCRAGARVLLLDAARDRLFLADSDLHRLLHDPAARDRRPALQRHDGADRLHPVPGRCDADRHPSPVRRSAGRRRLQIHAFGVHRAGRAADPADRLHDLRFGRDRRAPARRAGACSAGSRRCPGTTRSCSLPRFPSSCSASAAPAG